MYFAFGSNLDELQMLLRCPSARLIGPAVLEEYALAFGGHSRHWGGAVATVRASKGDRVEGLAYDLSTEDVAALDKFEGVPAAYERLLLPIEVLSVGVVRAHVYRHMDEATVGLPSARYSDVLRDAYLRHRFDSLCLARAMNVGRVAAKPAATVFVYGSLLFGEGNHGVLRDAAWLGPARTLPDYTLLDLGAYPAMVASGGDSIVGELYAVGAATLRALDRLEGHPDDYRRTPVSLADGQVAEAYVLIREPSGTPRTIASGDWRSRRSSIVSSAD